MGTGSVQVAPLPSLRTISRIVSREGLTHRRTGRYEPKRKRYPTLKCQHANEVHQSDYVGSLLLERAVALLRYEQRGPRHRSLCRDARL